MTDSRGGLRIVPAAAAFAPGHAVGEFSSCKSLFRGCIYVSSFGACSISPLGCRRHRHDDSFSAAFSLRAPSSPHHCCENKTPAAYTMISDLFPASARGTANSIYSGGVYLGGALASLSLLLNGEPRPPEMRIR